MRKLTKSFIFCVILLSHFLSAKAAERKPDPDYIFFLHNKFLEENALDALHIEYGKSAYNEILDTFRKDGFVVFSEKRPAKTDVRKYALKVISQIDSLLNVGVKANHITIIGTSKGGYIAQYISTYMANPDLNFVFIGSFRNADITNYPEINFCGNILTIYEKSDEYGVSALKRKENSTLKINHFKEIELTTNLKHGFLYRNLDLWVNPCKMWARRNYALKPKAH